MDHENAMMKEVGNTLFPATAGYATKEVISAYEPITYFDKNDPPFFLWHGGQDDQVPAPTFEKFASLLKEDSHKNKVVIIPEELHSPNETELKNAYTQLFLFLDKL